MASNKEIVKAVLRETTLFHGATVCEYSGESQVKIVTKAVFVRMSDLYELHLAIAGKGGKVRDIEVSPMPTMDNRLSVVVVFNE